MMTAAGQCFRHEISWKVDPLRKLEFSMREIVFIGDNEYINEIRKTLLEHTWQCFHQLGLSGKVTTANDPFFFYDDMDKANYQLMANSKYELVAVTEKKDVSIASFNDCGEMLCERFQIKEKMISRFIRVVPHLVSIDGFKYFYKHTVEIKRIGRMRCFI